MIPDLITGPSTPEEAAPPDPWDVLVEQETRAPTVAEQAALAERATCLTLVDAEIDQGVRRGLHDGSPVMQILRRIRERIVVR